MATPIDIAPADDRELVLARIIDASPDKVFRCWAEAELLKRWFAPRPWSTPKATLDVRSGGSSRITMASPEGEEFPNGGVFLEVVPNHKLVFTDAYTGSTWEPSAKPFMTVVLTLEDQGGKTRYIARCRHWSADDRKAHEEMGFHQGWGQCADQLEEVARSL
jgi:uncharacterized protein YndB with AHSA1/START domain